MTPDSDCSNSPLFARQELDDVLADLGLADQEQARVREYRERGYLVIDLQDPQFESRAASIIQALAPQYPPQDRRIEEAWYAEPGVKALAIEPQILQLLQVLYGRRPIPFQTLNFDSGTEQATHSDTLHFHCRPERYMAGVWIALEDVDGDNGPLVVYPGSHRLPVETMGSLGLEGKASAYPGYERGIAKLIEEQGLVGHELPMRKGHALIWAANLLHGGTAIRDDKRTRHSQVTHYYFDNCAYHVPLASEPEKGRYTHREVIDISTSQFVPHLHEGREIRLSRLRTVQRYPRPLPRGVLEPRDWMRKPLRLFYSLLGALGR